jgi:hypothetical protein
VYQENICQINIRHLIGIMNVKKSCRACGTTMTTVKVCDVCKEGISWLCSRCTKMETATHIHNYEMLFIYAPGLYAVFNIIVIIYAPGLYKAIIKGKRDVWTDSYR